MGGKDTNIHIIKLLYFEKRCFFSNKVSINQRFLRTPVAQLLRTVDTKLHIGESPAKINISETGHFVHICPAPSQSLWKKY